MKKKCIISAIIIICFILSHKLEAQKNASADIYLNVGYSKDSIFKFNNFLLYMGGNLDIHLNKYLVISPEVNLVTYNFSFKRFLLESVVLLKVKIGTIFVGAGIGKFFLIGKNEVSDPAPSLKMNIGLPLSSRIQLKMFVDFGFGVLSNNVLIGTQIGIGF